jgi:hypothetical protein
VKIHSDWLRRICPACKSTQNPTLEVSSEKPAEQASFDEVASGFIGLRSKQVFFSYYRCKECGLLYCPYYFNTAQLDELYSAMPDNLMGEDKSTVSKTQEGYVRWIARQIDVCNKYLEIGPDIGLVAKHIPDYFELDLSVMVEPNKAIHHELSLAISKSKQQRIFEYINEVPLEQYDLIVGIHVYDHLLNPIADLCKLREFSNPSTNLAIVVHNEQSILRNLLNKKWPPFCLQHPQLYSPRTLDRVLSEAGWEKIISQRTTNWWHLRHFIKLASQVLGLPTSFSRLFPNFEIPFKVGNFITLAKPNQAFRKH